ncbi:MAG: choice-of-anchor D domain-containing protein, partial [Ignavibacteriota bacterium]
YAGVGLNGTGAGNWLVYQGTSATTPKSNVTFAPPIPLPNIQLSANPKTVDFGFGLTGTNVDKIVTVTHTGTAGNLVISSASITGAPDYSIVGALPGPLGPGQSGNITVRFSAQVDGVRLATLNIISNGRDSGKQSISLTAKGVAPNIQVDSVIRFKKTRTRMGDTLRQWVRITSVGQAALFMLSYPITGIDADQYFISRFPTSPIAPGTTDSLEISYVPTKEGLRIATLTLNNNSFNAPSLTISLNGTGILPHIQVTPGLLLFDSTREGDTVCKSISIWNPGSDTLKIKNNFLSSNDGDFHYTGLTTFTDVNIPPDQTRTLTVCFIPLQQGFRQARIQLQTNIIKTFETPRRDTAGLISIDVRGTGVPFGVFGTKLSGTNFADSAFIGKQICRTASLSNDGDADILVNGFTIGGADASAFSYSGLPNLPFLLKARQTITFTLCGTPDKQGLLSANASVSGKTGGANISALLDLGVFGIKACIGAEPPRLFETTVLPNNGSDSTLCVTVSNCGDIDAIYHVSISGASKADYTVTPSVSGNVAAKTGTTVFCVKYKPSAEGPSPASLDISADDASTSVQVPLDGSAGCPAVVNSTPQVPNTGENEKQTFTFTITNSGQFQWDPGTESFTGTGAGAFSIISIVPPPPLAPGGTAIVTAEFHPAAGSKGTTFTAQLAWPNAGPCGNKLNITLNGNSVTSSVPLVSSADGFSLEQSYPNPTSGSAVFNFRTPRECEVRVALLDLTGKLIRTFISGRVSEGTHSVKFEASEVPSGTYIYTLESGSTRLVKQMILAR